MGEQKDDGKIREKRPSHWNQFDRHLAMSKPPRDEVLANIAKKVASGEIPMTDAEKKAFFKAMRDDLRRRQKIPELYYPEEVVADLVYPEGVVADLLRKANGETPPITVTEHIELYTLRYRMYPTASRNDVAALGNDVAALGNDVAALGNDVAALRNDVAALVAYVGDCLDNLSRQQAVNFNTLAGKLGDVRRDLGWNQYELKEEVKKVQREL